jgi:hypothetical protein
MTCHKEGTNSLPVRQAGFCTTKKLAVSKLKQNCIQCHMPEQNSNSIRMLLQGEDIPTPARMHAHTIAIYPDEVVKFIKSIPLSKN